MPLIDEEKPEFVTEMASDRSDTVNSTGSNSTSAAPAASGSASPVSASNTTVSTAVAEPSSFVSSSPTRNRTLVPPIRFRARTRRPPVLFASPTDSEDDTQVLPSATSQSSVISIHSSTYANDDDDGVGMDQQRQSEGASRAFNVILDDDEDDDFYRGPRYSDFRVTNMEVDSTNEDDDEDEYDNTHVSASSPQPMPVTLRLPTSQRTRVFTPLGSSSRFIPSPPSSSAGLSTSTSTSTSPVRGGGSIGSRFSPGRRHITLIARLLAPEIKSSEEDEISMLLRGEDDSLETQVPFRLPASSFVRSGMQFNGTQNLMNSPNEEWNVKVSFHHVDFKSLSLVGLMEAMNVPHCAHNVITYWEGEIIDFAKYNLWTNKWKANLETDLQHWGKFEAFRNMDIDRIMRGGRIAQKCIKWLSQKYIFMRWKERCFVNISAQDSGLTIAGFYYICMRRSDGNIEGYYFDRDCTLYQKLMLKPWTEACGFSFSQASFR